MKHKTLPARIGDYRAPRETHVRITAESCVNALDMHLLTKAEPVNGFVEFVPTGERKPAVFIRLKIEKVKPVMLAHRITGTLYRAHDGVSSSPDLKAVLA